MQGLEDVQDQVDDLLELFLDLVLAAEQVRIVLGESADAGQAVQFTGLLIAVHGAELGIAQGQFLVGVRGAAVDLAVVGAVHGLEGLSMNSSPSCGVWMGWKESLPYLA